MPCPLVFPELWYVNTGREIVLVVLVGLDAVPKVDCAPSLGYRQRNFDRLSAPKDIITSQLLVQLHCHNCQSHLFATD